MNKEALYYTNPDCLVQKFFHVPKQKMDMSLL